MGTRSSAVLIPVASEAEWLAARRKGVTASEIAVIMGIAPESYGSAYKLYHQKLGILPPDDDHPEMERGRDLEPVIARKFAAAHPDLALLGDGRSLYAHPDRPWQLATPDRIAHEIAEVDACTCAVGPSGYYGMHERYCGEELGEPVAVAEYKSDGGSDEWGEPGTDEIPVHYRAQVLWQMDVMGFDRAYIACLRIRDWKILTYEIGHAEGCGAGRNMLAYPSLACPACDDIAIMRDEAREFLDRIDRQDPPDVDWRPATIGALKTLHPSVEDTTAIVSDRLARWYHAACRNEKHWEQRKKLYEARIRQQMGSAHRAYTAITSEPVARRDVYPVREHVRSASTVDKLVPVYPKEKK